MEDLELEFCLPIKPTRSFLSSAEAKTEFPY